MRCLSKGIIVVVYLKRFDIDALRKIQDNWILVSLCSRILVLETVKDRSECP